MVDPTLTYLFVTFLAQSRSTAEALSVLTVFSGINVTNADVLILVGRADHFIPHAIIGLLERMFSVLGVALAVQIIVDGPKDLGVV